jgi:hypothetical protein
MPTRRQNRSDQPPQIIRNLVRTQHSSRIAYQPPDL